jgi:hypothetical protein
MFRVYTQEESINSVKTAFVFSKRSLIWGTEQGI